MHEHELRMIEVDKTLLVHQHDYDAQKIDGLTSDDLTPEIVHRYLHTARSRITRLRDRTDDEILRRTGVLVSTGEPTLAGLYAMGDYPQGYFPSLTVTAAVQLPRNASAARTRNLQHFAGPVPELLGEVMSWCENNMSLVRAYRDDGHMVERTELPMTAIRELVANALVHRDLGPNTLGAGKSIQIRLTPTNLFIQSPGGLRGVSVEQLRSSDHAQAAVNQKLYSIAQKLTTDDGASIIEGEGGGIREVLHASQRYGLRAPTFINKGVEFKAILWRPQSNPTLSTHLEQIQEPHTQQAQDASTGVDNLADNQELTKNEPTVLKMLKNGHMSFSALLAASNLTRGQLRYALNSAIASGRVSMMGSHGQQNTQYRLNAS